MKKTYQHPCIRIRSIVPAQMLAFVSGQNDGIPIIDGGDEGGDPGTALGKPSGVWDEDNDTEDDDTYSPFIH